MSIFFKIFSKLSAILQLEDILHLTSTKPIYSLLLFQYEFLSSLEHKRRYFDDLFVFYKKWDRVCQASKVRKTPNIIQLLNVTYASFKHIFRSLTITLWETDWNLPLWVLWYTHYCEQVFCIIAVIILF